jgi:replication-associated recombination protein RarA
MTKLISTFALILVSLAAVAQHEALKYEIGDHLQNDHSKIMIEQKRADEYAAHLLKEYEQGEEYMDAALKDDDSWYAGIDLYIDKSKKVIMRTIKYDEEAEFRKEDAKYASVSVAYNGTDYIVLVVTYYPTIN